MSTTRYSLASGGHRGSPRDTKDEFIDGLYNKLIATRESINDMMNDLMDFKEEAVNKDNRQKMLIQELQERVNDLEDRAGWKRKGRSSGWVGTNPGSRRREESSVGS